MNQQDVASPERKPDEGLDEDLAFTSPGRKPDGGLHADVVSPPAAEARSLSQTDITPDRDHEAKKPKKEAAMEKQIEVGE